MRVNYLDFNKGGKRPSSTRAAAGLLLISVGVAHSCALRLRACVCVCVRIIMLPGNSYLCIVVVGIAAKLFKWKINVQLGLPKLPD